MTFKQLPRSQPLLMVTLAYMGGIVIVFTCPRIELPFLLPVFTALLAMFLLLFQRKYGFPALLLFFLFLGIHLGNADTTPPSGDRHILNQIREMEGDLTVVGKIRRIFSYTGETSRFDVDTLAIRSADSDFLSLRGTIRYSLKAPLPATFSPGDTVLVRARLQPPHRFATPGVFDYRSYLARTDIYVTGYLRSPLHIAEVENQTTPIERFLSLPERLRHAINRFIDKTLNGDQAALYKALLTGDRSAIQPATLELFKGTGTLHILAISGIHMSLLGLFLFTVFFWLLRRSRWLTLNINTKKTAAFLCVLPLLFYALIAGAKIPVTRSLIMSLIVITAVCYGRRHSFAPLISCAALIILIISPSQLASPSFQLTFSAVIAITAAIPLVLQATEWITDRTITQVAATVAKWIAAAMIVSLAATLGTAPLIIYHFHRISSVGIIANLIIEPVICLWALILGFMAVLILPVIPALAGMLLHLGAAGISLAISSAQLFYAIPHSSIHLPAPPIPLIILYYLLFIPLIYRLRNGFFSTSVSLALAAFSVGLLLFFQPAEVFKQWREESQIVFLDVGHGSSTLLEMPGGKRVIVDGGALSSPDFDIGERVIAPFLFSRGIASIDDIVITHPDSDHFNGIPYLLDVMDVANIWLPVADHHAPGWRRLVDTARDQGVAIHVPRSGQTLFSTTPATIELLANTAEIPPLKSNDTGLVIRYRHGDFSVLFPGDISKESEKKLVSSGVDLRASILLASHHGSDTSNSAAFLERVGSETVVVSSGGRRGLTLPAPAVVRRCRVLGMSLMPLHLTGTVTVTTKKGEYRLDTLLPYHPVRSP